MLKWINSIRIAILHAKYHRCMKYAINARTEQNLVKFKKYVYQAEDAWRKMVIIIEKQKENNG